MTEQHCRVTIISIEIANGNIVNIPLTDLICSLGDEGQKIFAGWVYDIFATPEPQHSRDEVLY